MNVQYKTSSYETVSIGSPQSLWSAYHPWPDMGLVSDGVILLCDAPGVDSRDHSRQI